MKPNEQIGSLLLNWVNSIMLKHINDYEAMVSKLSKIRKDEKIEGKNFIFDIIDNSYSI